MKKIMIVLILLAILFLEIPFSVYANGSISPSPRSLSIIKGGSASFRVTASNACGRVDISSSDSSVASVDVSSQWLENNSVTVTVTGVSAGSATITVRLSDAATFDEEELSGSYSVNVTVSEPQPQTPVGDTGNSNNNSNSGSSNSSNSQSTINTSSNNNQKTEDNNLSKNSNIKTLSVDGYELTNTEENTYELVVMNNITKINISATAEDSKATVTGTGEKQLEIGLNIFDVIVVSESGAKKSYTIKVTRKDDYYLDDLNNVLSDEEITNPEIVIDKETNITGEMIEKIKNSGKNVIFKCYNENKEIIYSWIIDGSKVKDLDEFNTGLTFTTENAEKIGEASNYADGMYLNFEHSGNLPKGTKIRIYVGDKFEDGKHVNVYYYDNYNRKMDLIENGLIVTDGYIEFEINHCSVYFVTRSTINETKANYTQTDKYKVLSIITIFILLIVIILDLFKINPILKVKK